MKAAMKAKDKLALSVIRMARAAVKNEEIDTRKSLTDDDVIAILAKEMKLRKDSLAEFEKSDRKDLADQTKAEMEILQKYLPTPLTADEIRETVHQLMQTVPAEERDLGTAMKIVMPELKGKADGKLVNQIVREYIAQK